MCMSLMHLFRVRVIMLALENVFTIAIEGKHCVPFSRA